jgi:predicted component of type VI protein secretion system
MDLKLKVLEGKNVGQEIPVNGKKFFVGRAEDCNMRPGSDLISRHHCVLLIEDGYLGVRDFGSKNGTYVNDERVVGERELKAGDRLSIGPLRFEVCINHGLAAKKRPPVVDIKEAAARTAQDASKDPFDVAEWLSDESEDVATVTASTDTQSVSMTDTDSIRLDAAAETAGNDAAVEAPTENTRSEKPAKRTPGKLPPVPNATVDSQAAAAAMLGKLRRRR